MSEFDFGAYKKDKPKKERKKRTTKSESTGSTVEGNASPTIERIDVKTIIEDTANTVLDKIKMYNMKFEAESKKELELRRLYSSWTWKNLLKRAQQIYHIKKIDGIYLTNCTSQAIANELVKKDIIQDD